MYIKIYFNERPLFLCDEMTDEIRAYAHHDDAVLIDEYSPPAVNSMIHEMRRESVHAGIFIHSDLQALKRAFWKKFKLVQAGGGLVRDPGGKYLFMLRRGKWDLPKGHLEARETLEQCAIREVGEETALKQVQLDGPLLITYHTYDESGHHILKETHWFRMSLSSDQQVVPQQEEEITELKWVDEHGVAILLRQTFPSIIDVFNAELSRP